MFLNISDLSDEPLQSQIVRQVRAMILSGEIPAGTMLPSIRGLSKQEQVCFTTIQRAYEILVNKSLIHSRRGKGFFVTGLSESNKKKMAKERLLDIFIKEIDLAEAEGLNEDDIRKTLESAFIKAKKLRSK